VLVGGDGPDVLAGAEGSDQLDGGAGDDQLSGGEERTRNRIACGEGNDHADPAVNTLIGPDCEHIGIDDFDLGGIVLLRLPLSSPRAALLTMKPQDCFYHPCTVRLSVTAKNRLLGETKVTRRKRTQKLPSRLSLRLSKAGARALKRAGHLLVRVRVVVNEDGDVSASSFLIQL
jgi:Ca2+-binding RTX toxin-like protein